MSRLHSSLNHLQTLTFMSMELPFYLHLHPSLDSNLLSYLGESLTNLLAPSISVFIPLSYSLLFAFVVLMRDRPRERNDASLSDLLGGHARRWIMRPCSRYAIRFNTCWSRCHKWVGPSKDPADRKMHSVCLESVIGSEFEYGVTTDSLLTFSQFTERGILVLSCCV
jgi:hypothetical protein